MRNKYVQKLGSLLNEYDTAIALLKDSKLNLTDIAQTDYPMMRSLFLD